MQIPAVSFFLDALGKVLSPVFSFLSGKKELVIYVLPSS